jgi:hypothetical protein
VWIRADQSLQGKAFPRSWKLADVFIHGWKWAEIFIDQELVTHARLALCVWRGEKALRKAQLKPTPSEIESA